MPQKSWKSETVYRSKKSEWAFKEDWIERQDRSWWKRRLENQVKGPNKDLRRLNALLEGKKMKKKKHQDNLQKRYKLKEKGKPKLKEEILQKIKVKTAKINR